ncbi:MAG: ABC transporter ATP-binding protein [Bacilli bacterium]
MDSQSTLKVSDLGKRIGKRDLLKGVSFEVLRGEIFGFLGPNGAGKTTTMRILTGLMKPTSGDIRICGYDIRKQLIPAMSTVGAIVENPESFRYLTGWQNLCQAARMSGKAISKSRIHECVEIVGLSNRIHEKVQGYSLGMKQRLGLAGAILSSPRLLILDEPTNGMDPRGVRDMRDLLVRLSREQGMSVFISTHLLLEAQAVCDRVAILDQGMIVACGSKAEIASRFSDSEYEMQTDSAQIGEALALMRDIGVECSESSGSLLVRTDRKAIPQILRHLLDHEIEVFEITRRGSALEDYFIKTTKETLV